MNGWDVLPGDPATEDDDNDAADGKGGEHVRGGPRLLDGSTHHLQHFDVRASAGPRPRTTPKLPA